MARRMLSSERFIEPLQETAHGHIGTPIMEQKIPKVLAVRIPFPQGEHSEMLGIDEIEIPWFNRTRFVINNRYEAAEDRDYLVVRGRREHDLFDRPKGSILTWDERGEIKYDSKKPQRRADGTCVDTFYSSKPGFVRYQGGEFPDRTPFEFLQIVLRQPALMGLDELIEPAPLPIRSPISDFRVQALAVERDGVISVNYKHRVVTPGLVPTGPALAQPSPLFPIQALLAEGVEAQARYCPHGVALETGIIAAAPQTPHASARGAHASYR